MVANLQALAKEIDQDFQRIGGTSFKRRALYYSLSLDDRLTSIIARRTTRIAYLIDTEQASNTYTRLYLEDWQIGVILAGFDENSLKFLKDWLIGVYGGNSIEEHRIIFSRTALHDGIDAIASEVSVDIIYLEDVSNLTQNVNTNLGFSITTRSFVDFLCLTLSMEDTEKLRIELTKHCMIADLLTGKNEDLIRAVAPQLASIKTIAAVEELYASMSTQQAAEEYDKTSFTEDVSKQYFGGLVSGL